MELIFKKCHCSRPFSCRRVSWSASPHLIEASKSVPFRRREIRKNFPGDGRDGSAVKNHWLLVQRNYKKLSSSSIPAPIVVGPPPERTAPDVGLNQQKVFISLLATTVDGIPV